MSRTTVPAPSKKALESSVPSLSSQLGRVRPHAEPESFVHQCVEAAIRGVCVVAVLALVLTLLLGLSGCGPGTGGTGVGPVTSTSTSFAFSGTTTVAPSTAVPTAPVTSPGLPVSPAVPVPVPGATPPPTVVGCTVNCATVTVTLQVEADRVVLQGGCFVFTSIAPLVVAANGPTVLAGTYQKFSTQAGQVVTSSTPANLSVQFANGQPDSNSVILSVRDVAGTLLVGPVTLSRTSTAAPTAGGASSIGAAGGTGAGTCP